MGLCLKTSLSFNISFVFVVQRREISSVIVVQRREISSETKHQNNLKPQDKKKHGAILEFSEKHIFVAFFALKDYKNRNA